MPCIQCDGNDLFAMVKVIRDAAELARTEKKKQVPIRLYDLDRDIAESSDVAAAHPDVVARIEALAERCRQDLGDRGRSGAHQRPAGIMEDPGPLTLSGR